MNHFTEHLAQYSKELNLKFEGIRKKYTDSDVKGAENEKALQEFIKEHYPAWSVRLGCQVISFSNEISDELDVTVCNKHQAFAGEESSLLIAEGVDFVIQSKAVLNDKEIKRAIKNCKKLKNVRRASNKDDIVRVPPGSNSRNVPHIPYIIFAFSSQLKEETVLDKLVKELKKIPYELQPDALYILDRGKSFINLQDGKSNFLSRNGKSVKGWGLVDTGEQTLSEMLRFVATQIPTFMKWNNPLISYLKFDNSKIQKTKS